MRLADRYSKPQSSEMLKIFLATEKMDGVLNLGIGEPDFDTEHDIIDAAAAAGKNGFTHYPPTQGYIDTREAVCGYWKRHHALESAPEEVLLTSGGIQAPFLAMQALLNPGDEIILIEPYFTPYAVQADVCGASLIKLETKEENGFAPLACDLENAITPRTRVLVLNSPCNPTGRVVSRERMEEIAGIAERHDLFVLSDEIYESLVHRGKHISFATLPGMKERTLTMGGVSKSHCMTGWRMGYAIGPVELIRTMTAIAASQTYGLNTMTQKAAAYAITNHDAKLIERRSIFAERMNYVAGRLNKMKNVTCDNAEGAFYLFPNIKGIGIKCVNLVWKLLEDAHVATIPGTAFGSSGEGYIRIACTRSMEVLTQAMDRMEAFCEKL
ncbi:MAG: pyridoxal phosphate-dependent aminotransferase [Synergistaceae bacterium]|nr:pyridoxal phosphate-dependent aminotransferase [Synergistaceae bacterium]